MKSYMHTNSSVSAHVLRGEALTIYRACCSGAPVVLRLGHYLPSDLCLVAERIAPLSDRDVADLCASFQAAVVDVMVDRTRAGLRAYQRSLGVVADGYPTLELLQKLQAP